MTTVQEQAIEWLRGQKSMQNNPFFSDPKAVSESLEFGKIGGLEPKRIEPNHDLKWKHNQLTNRLKSLLARPESDFGVNGKWKKEFEVDEVKKDIADIEREIENIERFRSQHWVTCECDRIFDKANDEHGTIENWKGQCGRDHFCSVDCAEKFSSGHPGEKVGQYPGKNVNNHSDLVKENQELRQELSEVKNQLAEVLEEL